MRIAYITSGAAGMFCGSCMRDNTLVAALCAAGHDALLVPTYTPIRTDEPDVSEKHVYYGGINVYLEQKTWLFRHTPRFIDWLFNRPFLLKWATKAAATADYGMLADLTVSMLQGDHGRQRKELDTLVAHLKADAKPEVVVLSNVLLSGMVPTLKQELGVPVLATLQGDDIFLDVLPAPQRTRCLELIRANDRHVDGFFSTSHYYADHMSGYLGIDRGKIHVVWPGLNLKGHGGPPPPRGDRPPTIGYFARVCPEKGFQNLVEAFIRLRRTPGAPAAVLRASGWLGAQHKPFLDEQRAKLAAAGLANAFEYVESPTHADKVRFLHGVDVLSVPTDYREPKGLYILEAWANGVPVVQPAHGSFPELIEATRGGLAVEPGNPDALAAGLRELLENAPLRDAMGERGRTAVRERFPASRMAAETVGVLNKYVRPEPAPASAPA